MALRKSHNYTIYINKLKVITFGLLFFLLQACNKEYPIQIITKNDVIEIAKGSSNFSANDIKISLHNSVNKSAMLGKIIDTDTSYIFKPTIPFTKGLKYNVYIRGDLVKSIIIKKDEVNLEKVSVNIYPSKDTLPENLLKMYFEFSKPMKEVNNSLDYITVRNLTKDSVVDVFLKLSPELWNKNHSRLTLWLDPGRVKTDLIPNKILGLPLQAGNKYRIEINNEWEGVNGGVIDSYIKEFYVFNRDDKSPNIKEWSHIEPKQNTRDTLKIDFNESLDAVLSKENIFIIDEDENRVEGQVSLTSNESLFNFVPKTSWKKGVYRIDVDPKLEDLAGNNLTRLFDVDNTTKVDVLKKDFNVIEFKVN